MTITNNSLFVLHPYVHNGTWVFDDEERGLIMEPFVAGADTLLDKVYDATVDEKGDWNFGGLIFSSEPLPQTTLVIRRTEEDPDRIGTHWIVEGSPGETYQDCQGHELWLCPALYEFFENAPEYIYIKVEERNLRNAKRPAN